MPPHGQLIEFEIPETFTPGEVFWMYFTVANNGDEGGTITCKVTDEDTGLWTIYWKDLNPGDQWLFSFDWLKSEKTDFHLLVETGHWNAEIIVDEEYHFIVKLPWQPPPPPPPEEIPWLLYAGIATMVIGGIIIFYKVKK